MKQSIISSPQFHNEESAYEYVESMLWPDGPVCPHCGGMENSKKMQGKSTRIGLYKCYDCRKPFIETDKETFEKACKAILKPKSHKQGLTKGP